MNLVDALHNVTIVGEGPAGATTAILAVGAGYQVTLIKKRELYTREQIIFLNDSSLNLLNRIGILKNLSIVPFNMDGQVRGLVKIKKLEKSLNSKLESLGVNIIHGEFLSLRDNRIVIKNGATEQVLSYGILVGADGARSSVRESLNMKCHIVGNRTIVGSAFIPAIKSSVANMQELQTEDFYIRKVSTPVGCFILQHNKISGSAENADRHSILAAARTFNWVEEAKVIEDENLHIVNIENVTAKLKQADKFVDQEQRAILVGDATTTGSFYLGRGANLALKTAELAERFLQMLREGSLTAFDWFNKAVKIESDALLSSNRHLFD